MQIVIDIPEEVKNRLCFGVTYQKDIQTVCEALNNGTPLQISKDGTLIITVDDATKVGRVLVQDNKNNGGLFYADST